MHKHENIEPIASLLKGGALWGVVSSFLVIFFEATISLQIVAPIFVFAILAYIATQHDHDWSIAEHREQRWMIAGFIIAYYCFALFNAHVLQLRIRF